MSPVLQFPAHLLQLLQEHLSNPGGPLKAGDHFLLPLSQAVAGSDGVGEAFQGEACGRRRVPQACPAPAPLTPGPSHGPGVGSTEETSALERPAGGGGPQRGREGAKQWW